MLQQTMDTARTRPEAKAISDRTALIDVAKGIGICLIVLGHNTVFELNAGALYDVLASFRTPFFFFISGVTLSVMKRNFSGAVLQRADAWLKPCLVVVVALETAKILLGKSTLEGLATSVLYATGFTYSWPPLWFLPHLWLAYAFSFILLRSLQPYLRNTWVQAATFFGMTLSGFYWMQLFSSPRENALCNAQFSLSPDLFSCGLPLSADLLLVTSSFLILGYFCSHRVKAFKPMPIASLIALGGLIWLELTFNLRTDLNHREYNNILVSPTQALLGIFVMLNVCHWLSRCTLVERGFSALGRISLFILIFHSPVVYFITRNGPRWIDSQWAVGILAFVVPVLFSAMVHYACKNNRVLTTLMLPRKHLIQQRLGVAKATFGATH